MFKKENLKNRKNISLLILTAYCIPYIFLGMYADFSFSSIWIYVLAVTIITSLSILCKRTKRVLLAIAGNIITFASSYLFTTYVATENWNYYFKAFPSTIRTMQFSLFVLLMQILILAIKRK